VRGLFAGALAGAAALSGSPAVAQLSPQKPTGSILPRDPVAIDPDVVRRMQKVFGACIYARHRKQADLFLRHSEGNEADFEAIGFGSAQIQTRLSLPDCLGRAMTTMQSEVQLSFELSTLRSVLAEEAYLARHSAPLTIAEGATQAVSGRYFFSDNPADAGREVARFTDCVTFQAPVEADRLLRTRPASGEENSASQALVPAMSGCLFEGQEVNLTVPGIRAIVADGLWARSVLGGTAPVPASAQAEPGL